MEQAQHALAQHRAEVGQRLAADDGLELVERGIRHQAVLRPGDAPAQLRLQARAAVAHLEPGRQRAAPPLADEARLRRLQLGQRQPGVQLRGRPAPRWPGWRGFPAARSAGLPRPARWPASRLRRCRRSRRSRRAAAASRAAKAPAPCAGAPRGRDCRTGRRACGASARSRASMPPPHRAAPAPAGRTRCPPRARAAPAQPCAQGGAVVGTEIVAEALEQGFQQQLGFQLLDREPAANPVHAVHGSHQCSHTRIIDSSWATSTGLVM
jgi:hypothetical protein